MSSFQKKVGVAVIVEPLKLSTLGPGLMNIRHQNFKTLASCGQQGGLIK